MNIRLFKPLLASSLLLGLWSSAQAQVPTGGTITFGNSLPTSVPTLSEWGMILLSVVLAVLAARAIRRNQHGGTASSVMLAAAGALLVAAAMGMGDRAYAVISGIDAGTAPVGEAQGFYPGIDVPVFNSSSTDRVILSIAPASGYLIFEPGSSPQCQVGMRLPAGSSIPVCYIKACVTSGCSPAPT
jgi:hypothetical protein